MRYPAAKWQPVAGNYTPGGCRPRYLVLHIMQGSLAGTDSWFRNPAAQVSAHFGVGKDGTVIQWVDTDDTAWHAMNANPVAIGAEHEGYSGDVLTPAQVEATGRLLAWLHEHHRIPLHATDNPDSGAGLAWHGMGGAAWGDHPDCPGHRIVAQRPEILAVARAGHHKIAAVSADGTTTLAGYAAQYHTAASTVLRLTAEHGPSAPKFAAGLADHVNAVFGGSSAAADPVPAGTVLIVPA